MTGATRLIAMRQPTAEELQTAIALIQHGSSNMSGQEFVEATLPVVAEACTLYEMGKRKEDVEAALVAQGLEAGAAQVLTDKAIEIVESNRQMGTQWAAQHRAINLQFLAVVLFAGGLLLVGVIQVIRAVTT